MTPFGEKGKKKGESRFNREKPVLCPRDVREKKLRLAAFLVNKKKKGRWRNSP